MLKFPYGIFIETRFRVFDNRDYQWSNELMIKGRQLAQFDNFEFEPWLTFTPQGKHLATSVNAVALLPITGLDELLEQGCYWLKDYLAFHPATQSQLTICQNPYILAAATK